MDSMFKSRRQLSKPELDEKRVIWKLAAAMQELEQLQADVGARLLLDVLQTRYKDESCTPSPYLVLKGHHLPIDVGLFDEVILIEGHRQALLNLARPPFPAATQECPDEQQSASIGLEAATSTLDWDDRLEKKQAPLAEEMAEAEAHLRALGGAPVQAVEPEAVMTQAAPTKGESVLAPLAVFKAQELRVIHQIKEAGLTATSLPRHKAGKPGVKAKIRAALKDHPLFIGAKKFDKAWERLRATKEIGDNSSPALG